MASWRPVLLLLTIVVWYDAPVTSASLKSVPPQVEHQFMGWELDPRDGTYQAVYTEGVSEPTEDSDQNIFTPIELPSWPDVVEIPNQNTLIPVQVPRLHIAAPEGSGNMFPVEPPSIMTDYDFGSGSNINNAPDRNLDFSDEIRVLKEILKLKSKDPSLAETPNSRRVLNNANNFQTNQFVREPPPNLDLVDEQNRNLDELLKLYGEDETVAPTSQDAGSALPWNDNDNIITSKHVYTVGDEEIYDPFINRGGTQLHPSQRDQLSWEVPVQSYSPPYTIYVPVIILTGPGSVEQSQGPVQGRDNSWAPATRVEVPLDLEEYILSTYGLTPIKKPLNARNVSTGINRGHGKAQYSTPAPSVSPGTEIDPSENDGNEPDELVISSMNGIVQSKVSNTGPPHPTYGHPMDNKYERPKHDHENGNLFRNKLPNLLPQNMLFPHGSPYNFSEYSAIGQSHTSDQDRRPHQSRHNNVDRVTSTIPHVESTTHASINTNFPAGYHVTKIPHRVEPVTLNNGESQTVDSESMLSESYVNEMMDFALEIVNQQLKKKGKDRIVVPDIHETFKKRVGFVQVTGEFNADHGWFKNLSTLHRTADVQLNRVSNTLSVTCAVGLTTMQVGFDHYKANFINIGTEGRVLGTVNSGSITLKVSISITNNDSCKITLDELQVTNLSDPIMDVSGLGDLSWLLSQIGTWIASQLKSDVIRNVEENLSTTIRKALRRVKCQSGV